MPKILNVDSASREELANAVYIGRGSKWGNPYMIGVHGNRDMVVEKYQRFLTRSPVLLRCLPELKDKDLICHCAPLRCHGESILNVIEDQKKFRDMAEAKKRRKRHARNR